MQLMRRKIVFGFVRKEFKQMFRDNRMRVVLFGSPLIMLLVFGYAVNTDVKNISFGVYDEDKTAQSREFVEKFSATGYFYYYTSFTSPSQIDYCLDVGKIEMAIHIPSGFMRDIRAGRTSTVQLLIDGADASRANVINAYVNAITADYALGLYQGKITLQIMARGGIASPLKNMVELKERFWFNPDLLSRNFFLPGILGLIISMLTITLTSMSIVKEREIGTIEQLVVSPIHPFELIAGKTIPFMLVSLADTVMITTLMLLWFGVPFLGSFFFMIFCSLGFIINTSAIGLYISTISRTQQQALLSVFLFFMPAMLFSGFVFPISAMPQIIQWITYINPLRYYVRMTRSIFLKGVGPAVLWPDLLALFGLGVVILFFSTRRFARRLE